MMERLKKTLVGFLAAILVGCGGASAIVILAEGGISGTGISFGTILGFGSVIVNGSKLEVTSETEIFIDEQPASESELNVGQVIRVIANFDQLNAERIDYVETVRGPIVTAPNINGDTLVGEMIVLNQTIKTNAATVFSNIADLTTLAANDVVDISGVRDADGSIVARFVELKPISVNEYRVIGRIQNIDDMASTFDIGGLTFDYASATIDAAKLANGVEVRVRGAATGYNQAGQLFSVDQVKDSVLSLNAGIDDGVEVEGVVTRYTSLDKVEVNGLKIDASEAEIENGVEADIGLNSLVEFEGVIDALGVLQASSAKLIPLGSIRVEAPVDSVNVDEQTLTMLGITFNITLKTQFEDDSNEDLQQFSLANIAAQAWLEVRGYQEDGELYAFRVERDDADTDVRLQGHVETFDTAGKTLSILGVAINTNGDTDYENEDEQGTDENDFFNTLTIGDLVKARWRDYTSTFVPVDELSFED